MKEQITDIIFNAVISFMEQYYVLVGVLIFWMGLFIFIEGYFTMKELNVDWCFDPRVHWKEFKEENKK